MSGATGPAGSEPSERPSLLERLRRLGRRRPPGAANPILEGPIVPTLLGLSVPMILGMFLVTGLGLVDMLYLGRYSKEAMAAISLAFPVTYLLHTIAAALGTASTSLCSRLIGQGEDRQVRNLVLHVLLVTAGASLVIGPLGILLLRPLLGATQAAPDVVRQAVRYGTIYYLGTPAALLPMAVNAMFRGEGDTIFPFKVMAIVLAVNIVLDPIFIFGPGPAPRLGVAGAAVTTVASMVVGFLIVVRELRKADRRVRLDRSAWRYDPSLLRGLGAVAGPGALANLSLPLSVYLINAMLAAYGTDALAAFGAGLRLLSFVFLPTLGVSLSMMIMVGQNHGAGRRRRVGRIVGATLAFSLSILAVLALPVIIFPRQALGLFTDEAGVIAAGAALARWVTMARPMLSVANITSLFFQARGQGLAGALPNVLMRVVLEPLGLYLGLRAGGLTTGWYGMAGGGFLGGILLLALLLWRLRVYVRQGDAASPAPAA